MWKLDQPLEQLAPNYWGVRGGVCLAQYPTGWRPRSLWDRTFLDQVTFQHPEDAALWGWFHAACLPARPFLELIDWCQDPATLLCTLGEHLRARRVDRWFRRSLMIRWDSLPKVEVTVIPQPGHGLDQWVAKQVLDGVRATYRGGITLYSSLQPEGEAKVRAFYLALLTGSWLRGTLQEDLRAWGWRMVPEDLQGAPVFHPMVWEVDVTALYL